MSTAQATKISLDFAREISLDFARERMTYHTPGPV